MVEATGNDNPNKNSIGAQKPNRDKSSRPATGKSGSGKDNGTRTLVIGMVVFVVLVGTIFSVVTAHNNSKIVYPASVSKVDGYGIVFNATAKPQLDLWEDFQCPVCQRFEAANNSYINQIVKSGKTKVIFHTMSFIGPESVSAAAAGACAADAGKFLQMHASLYINQPAHENMGTWTDQELALIGVTAGITSSSFSKCISDGKYINWTKSVENDASKKNVTGTPTVFVNGKQLDLTTQVMNAAGFKAALAAGGIA